MCNVMDEFEKPSFEAAVCAETIQGNTEFLCHSNNKHKTIKQIKKCVCEREREIEIVFKVCLISVSRKGVYMCAGAEL